jgi:hypothetical protein
VPDELPEPIRGYLDARAVGDVETALGLCVDDVVLVDVDVVHHGREQIRAVLSRPIGERHLTFRIVDATRIGDDRYDVINRIEGDLEGGAVELRYRFFLRHGRIEVLVIEFADASTSHDETRNP